MTLELAGKSNAVTFFVLDCAPTEASGNEDVKGDFLERPTYSRQHRVAQVPAEEHLFVLADANGSTGNRAEGGREKQTNEKQSYRGRTAGDDLSSTDFTTAGVLL